VRVATGCQQLLSDKLQLLHGRRVGLIVNPTAVDADLVHIVDRLAAASGVTIGALFGPEHGVRGDAQDMVAVAGERDAATGAPVFSLYGHTLESLTPTAAMLDCVDVVIYDVQDVGARYYTFVWTMVLAMRAAAKAKKAFIVLDRPNPIGGALREGGPIEAGFESFVGLVSCPNRHGLTAGEIARWRMAEEKLDLDLTVIPMVGWQRSMAYGDTGLPWVLPSPNMPTPETALVYPGMCLVEGSELSEGRGTTKPFEWSGAAHVAAAPLAAAMNAMALPGCVLRAATFLPNFHKHHGHACGGVQIHVTDARAFRPYLTAVAFLKAAHDQAPAQFAWRRKAYEFVDKIPAIDLLCGSSAVREGIDCGAALSDIAATWTKHGDWFGPLVEPYLLYR
jgi:uncharacterized protein YbbC (DUF1343 family)